MADGLLCERAGCWYETRAKNGGSKPSFCLSPVEIHELERLELAESISLGPLFSATPPDATFILPSSCTTAQMMSQQNCSKHITSFLQKLIVFCCLIPRPSLQLAFKHFLFTFD